MQGVLYLMPSSVSVGGFHYQIIDIFKGRRFIQNRTQNAADITGKTDLQSFAFQKYMRRTQNMPRVPEGNENILPDLQAFAVALALKIFQGLLGIGNRI